MLNITPEHLVAQALRVDHCSTGLKARVIVVVLDARVGGVYDGCMNLDHDIDALDSDPYFDAYDLGYLDFDGGYEDYEPNPYDGTYSED